jgi:hypothetical protein
MKTTTGTISSTGSGNGISPTLNLSPPDAQSVVGIGGTFTGVTMVCEGRLIGGTLWFPVLLRDRKTGTRYNGSVAISDSTATSFRAETAAFEQIRWYASAGTLTSVTGEVTTGSNDDFGGPIPQIDLAFAGTATYAGGLSLTGATGVNTISIPDNLASALDITESTNSYIKCVTTNGSESVDIGKVINAAAGVQGPLANEIVTATNVITAAESGKTFFLNSATEFVSTLPAPAAGLTYTFIVTAAPSGASYTVVTNSSANIIKGLQNSVAGDAGDSGTADDTITFVDGQAVAGDKVEVWSDGTSWFAYAISKVAAGITFTQAS